MLYVRDVDWLDPTFIRAGIIPQVRQGNTVFYAFSLDNCVGAIGDFGGHIEPVDRDGLDTAIREYSEESLNVFGVFTRDDLMDCPVIIGPETAEIIVPVPGPMYPYVVEFHARLNEDITHEVLSVIWLSTAQVLRAIENQELTLNGTKVYHMYRRLRAALVINKSLLE